MDKLIQKLGLVLTALILLGAYAIPVAFGQGTENPFGSGAEDASSLKGDIYYLPESTSSLPDFSTLTPVGTIYTKILDIPQRSFTSGFPGITDRFEWFAIRYTGNFFVENEGKYLFRLVSDDGSRLFIDGNKIIDNDGVHAPSSVTGEADLTRGQHQIEVDYFQGPREYIALQLFWTPPGGTETISEPQYVPSQPSGGTSTSSTGTNGGTSGPISGATAAPCSSSNPPDLTGVWSCDDGGTYYLKQIGNTVWWLGEISPDNPRWSNVAYGDIDECALYLEYADVPKGSATGSGSLVLEIVSNNEMRATEKPESYGGSRWWRVGGTSTSSPTGQPIAPPVVPPTGQTTTTTATNPWDDQNVRQLIDEWLLQQDRCVKKVYPGAYIDRWGRICGSTDSATISCTLTPDKPADWDNYHYLWYNNWCPDYYPYRVQDYVALRQSGESFDSLSECKAEGELCY